MLVDEWSRTRRGAEIIGHAETGSLFLEAVECIIAVGCGFTERRWCRLNEQASLLRCCWARERVVEVVLQLIELTGIVIPSGERRTGEKGEKREAGRRKRRPYDSERGPDNNYIYLYIIRHVRIWLGCAGGEEKREREKREPEEEGESEKERKEMETRERGREERRGPEEEKREGKRELGEGLRRKERGNK